MNQNKMKIVAGILAGVMVFTLVAGWLMMII